ncbi:beta-2-microglobulin-like [Gadus macrocephalus]|uniref:beta-2-microglobulin-like n=1 Tax=Gadus macrocephalus TaxID=80720 RepID=UPI0028CBB13F|nr:beta-2-microglobulin-like [Gadus macrocephalus]
MKITFCAVALALLLCTVESKESVPKVQVYSSSPARFGETNTLICLVQAFHPPEITIELLKNGAVLPNANQTDLSFDKTWHFHLSKFASISPSKEESYACQVTHIGKRTVHAWEPNM